MKMDTDKFNDELAFQAKCDYGFWNSVAKDELERIKKSDEEFKKWLKESREKN